jgi:predicted ATP-grasp superfamily ATP-dependent carboligase
VLEVNPRLTTAFVGLAARSATSLVAAMLAPDTLPCPAAGLVPCAVDFRIGTDA